MLENLFSRGELHGYLAHERERLATQIGQATAFELDDEQRREAWYRAAHIAPLELTEPSKTDVIEAKVRTGGGYSRSGEGTTVDGVRVAVTVPFTGDGGLFHYRPSTFGLNPPRGDIRGSSLTLMNEWPDRDANAIKQWRAQELAKVQQYVGYMNGDIATHNNSAASFVDAQIASRRAVLRDLLRLREELE